MNAAERRAVERLETWGDEVIVTDFHVAQLVAHEWDAQRAALERVAQHCMETAAKLEREMREQNFAIGLVYGLAAEIRAMGEK